jgi:hypothetical protein
MIRAVSMTADPRPLIAISPHQIAFILGIEHVLRLERLILVCPRCARDGYRFLQTDNAPHDPIWKINCGCHRRQIARDAAVRGVAPTAPPLLVADTFLRPLVLAVRCPQTTCLTTPLTHRGGTVTCQCRTH